MCQKDIDEMANSVDLHWLYTACSDLSVSSVQYNMISQFQNCLWFWWCLVYTLTSKNYIVYKKTSKDVKFFTKKVSDKKLLFVC